MGTNSEISRQYPKKIELDEKFLRLKPGAYPHTQQIPLRLMSAGDEAKILHFANGLHEEDLLFLRSDITDPATVDDWINGIEQGSTVTLLAEPEATLAAYASLHVNPLRWTRKVGEISINTAHNWQSRGLGESLCAEIVALAGTLELHKITAQMVADHKNARALFERLGFHVEALLPDWVDDRQGQCRDLLMMTYDLRAKGHPRELNH
jgi:L-amino acid N-acyltransferase YncA